MPVVRQHRLVHIPNVEILISRRHLHLQNINRIHPTEIVPVIKNIRVGRPIRKVATYRNWLRSSGFATLKANKAGIRYQIHRTPPKGRTRPPKNHVKGSRSLQQLRINLQLGRTPLNRRRHRTNGRPNPLPLIRSRKLE